MDLGPAGKLEEHRLENRRTPVTDVAEQSIGVVKSFFAAKERHDLDATMAPFAGDAVYTFPLNASGDPAPWFVYEGKEAIADYQRGVLERFAQLRMLDPQYSVSADGNIVFVESRGDYIANENATHYNNVYIFKFLLSDGKITHVFEYANPVTYAKLAGLPIG
jgi:ketosteroid isomerase-like protein